ncbi:prepilin peptidase [Chloroflexota bacterium]
MEVIWTAIFALLGIAVGSFLNVCIDRLPAGESLVFPASRCTACQKRLTIRDLVPVFSYLWLRGRCRQCKARIPKRLFWVELGTGVLFAYLAWHYGLSAELAVAAVYCCVFIALMVIDLERGIIPNKIVYPTMVVALIISIFLSPSRMIYSDGSIALLLNNLPEAGILQAVIGGGIGLVLFLLIAIISRGGMGWGDVKLAALIGMVTGYLVFAALLLAIILGGLIAVVLLLLKIKKRREAIPFGPYLSLGAIVILLFGGNLLNWYLGIF